MSKCCSVFPLVLFQVFHGAYRVAADNGVGFLVDTFELPVQSHFQKVALAYGLHVPLAQHMDAVLGIVAVDDGAVEVLQVVQNSGHEDRAGRFADASLLRGNGDFQGFLVHGHSSFCVGKLVNKLPCLRLQTANKTEF